MRRGLQFIFCSILLFAAIHVKAEISTSDFHARNVSERKEILNQCSAISRSLVKEKYFNTSEVTLVEMVTWLSAEDSVQNIYKFTSYAKLRKADQGLYSWTFSVVTQFSNQSCQILSERFDHETRLIEDDEDHDNEDDISDMI